MKQRRKTKPIPSGKDTENKRQLGILAKDHKDVFQTSKLLKVPDDALRYIFVFCNWDDLERFRLICKEFDRLINSELMYRLLLKYQLESEAKKLKALRELVRAKCPRRVILTAEKARELLIGTPFKSGLKRVGFDFFSELLNKCIQSKKYGFTFLARITKTGRFMAEKMTLGIKKRINMDGSLWRDYLDVVPMEPIQKGFGSKTSELLKIKRSDALFQKFERIACKMNNESLNKTADLWVVHFRNLNYNVKSGAITTDFGKKRRFLYFTISFKEKIIRKESWQSTAIKRYARSKGYISSFTLDN